MNGHNVFLPIGFDAFGLPAENAAIRSGVHPATWTMRNIENMRRQFRTMGAALRLVGRGRHLPARLLPLEPVDLPAAPEGRPGVSADGPGRLVPQGPGRPRARAGGGRRPGLLALWHAGRQARPRAVVLPHHALRRRAARLRGHRLARARAAHADELDRPLRGRRRRSSAPPRPPITPGARSCASSRRGRTRSSGPPSWSWPPSIRWSMPLTAPEQRAAVRGLRRGSSPRDRDRAALDRAREDRRAARRRGRQPGQRRAHPDLDRRLRAGQLRHGRDHGGARSRRARLRVRAAVRAAHPTRGRRPGRRGRCAAGRRPTSPRTSTPGS